MFSSSDGSLSESLTCLWRMYLHVQLVDYFATVHLSYSSARIDIGYYQFCATPLAPFLRCARSIFHWQYGDSRRAECIYCVGVKCTLSRKQRGINGTSGPKESRMVFWWGCIIHTNASHWRAAYFKLPTSRMRDPNFPPKSFRNRLVCMTNR